MSLFNSGGGMEKFEVILSARDQNLTSSLRHASTQLDETAERVKRLGEAYLVFEGLRKGIQYIKQFNAAAVATQQQDAQIKSSLKGQGEAWRGVGQHVLDTLDKMGKARGFLSGEMTDAFLKLETATGNSRKAISLLGDAQDLARGHNLSLSTAALLVSKAVEGNDKALSRYGITLPKVTTATDAFRKKLDEGSASHAHYTTKQREAIDAQKKWDASMDKTATGIAAITKLRQIDAGAADAYARTTAGRYATMQANIETLQGKLGAALLPGESKLIGTVTGYVQQLEASKSVQRDFASGAQAVGNGFGDIVSAIKTVGPPIVAVTGDIKDFVNAIGGVGPIIAATTAYYGASKALGIFAGQYERYLSITARGAAAVNAGNGIGTAELIATGAAPNARPFSSAPALARRAQTIDTIGVDTAGLAAQASAYSRVGQSADQAAAEVAKAENATRDVESAAAKAAPGIATFGAGLAEAFNPVTLAVGSVALLAGGLYLLSQQESGAAKAANALRDALKGAGDASDKFHLAGRNLLDDRAQVRDDRTNLAVAKNNVATTRKQLATAPYDERPAIRLALQQNENAVKDAGRQLFEAEQAVSHDNQAKAAAANRHLRQSSAAGLDAAQVYGRTFAATKGDITHQLAQGFHPDLATSAAANGNYTKAFHDTYEAAHSAAAGAAEAAAGVKAFNTAIEAVATSNTKAHPAIAATATALEGYVKKTGKVPKTVDVQYVLEHAKADASVASVTKEIAKIDKKQFNASLHIDPTNSHTVIASIISEWTNWVPPTKNLNVVQHRTNVGPSPGGATGMSIAGAYGRDDVPVWVTGGEAILNPRQIRMVDSGSTVMGALRATGAPTIHRGRGYATGATPGYSAVDQGIATADAKKGHKKGKGSGHGGSGSGHKASGPTPDQNAMTAYQANYTAFQQSISGLDKAYAQDQAANAHRPRLAADLTALIHKWSARAAQTFPQTKKGGKWDFADVRAAINEEKAGDYGTISGFKSDLIGLNPDNGQAPGSVDFGKKISGLQLKFDTAQTNSNRTVPAGGSAASRAAAAIRIRSAKANVGRTRQQMISAYQARISRLRQLQSQARRNPAIRKVLGAILSELDTDQTALGTLLSDKATDAAAQQQVAQDAAQAKADIANTPLNNDYYQRQLGTLDTAIARDIAGLPAGVSVSDQLQADTQAEFDFVKSRTGTLEGILASPYGSPVYRASVSDELKTDYGILSGITQGNTGAGGSQRQADQQTQDQSDQIAQLQNQLAIANRSAGLANATVSAFGSSGDIGSGGYANAYQAAQLNSAPQINIYTLHPGDPNTLAAIANASNSGNSLQQGVPNDRTSVNI